MYRFVYWFAKGATIIAVTEKKCKCRQHGHKIKILQKAYFLQDANYLFGSGCSLLLVNLLEVQPNTPTPPCDVRHQ